MSPKVRTRKREPVKKARKRRPYFPARRFLNPCLLLKTLRAIVQRLEYAVADGDAAAVKHSGRDLPFLTRCIAEGVRIGA
jgi:hypothetical protein